jgi:hypothetical protein
VTDPDRLRRLYESIHDSTTNGAPSPVVVERADALIAALGDEIAELTGLNIDLEVWRASAVKRAEKAEAERDEYAAVLKAIHDNPEGNVEQLQADLAALEAELALRDRMLRLLFDTCYQMSGGRYFGHINGVEGWLTDLKARAEKEAER